MTRTVNELLFGYKDPFLTALKEMDPMLGGDPSITDIVAFNEPNITLEESDDIMSMYTGYSDPMLTRVFRTYQNKEYITYNRTYFDGYNIRSEWVNPYMEPFTLYGSDGAQGKPLSKSSDKQYIFSDSLFRVGELRYTRSVKKYGFDLLRYNISDRMFASSEEYP